MPGFWLLLWGSKVVSGNLRVLDAVKVRKSSACPLLFVPQDVAAKLGKDAGLAGCRRTSNCSGLGFSWGFGLQGKVI